MLTPADPRRGALLPGRYRPAIGLVATLVGVGLVAQACGVAPMGGGMGSMGGGMMGSGMMGSDQRYADASALPPIADGVELRVVAGEMYFEPSEVSVTAGTSVNLTIDNEGAAFHDLTIPALDFVLAADAGTEASGSLATALSGTYEFLCSVPGHAQAGMTGTLLVE